MGKNITTIIYERRDPEYGYGLLRLYHGIANVEELEPVLGKEQLSNSPEWKRGTKWKVLPDKNLGQRITPLDTETYRKVSLNHQHQYESALDYKVTQESECPYSPLIINCQTHCCHDEIMNDTGYNISVYDGNNNRMQASMELISDFFGIPRMNELRDLSIKNHCKMFVVKRIENLYVFRHRDTDGPIRRFDVRYGGLVILKDKKNYRTNTIAVPWKERFQSCVVNGLEQKHWKKTIKGTYIVGDNGLALIDQSHYTAINTWPMDKRLQERFKKGELIPYGKLSMLSKEYKEELRLQEERLKKEEQERYRLRMLEGHCSQCGSKNAEYVKIPYRDIDGWYCESCLNDIL